MQWMIKEGNVNINVHPGFLIGGDFMGICYIILNEWTLRSLTAPMMRMCHEPRIMMNHIL